MFLEKCLDLLVNLITALLLFLIPWVWYQYFSKIPLKGYFVKTKKNFISNRNYYKIGFSPNGEDHFENFESMGIVAIGWPKIGTLDKLVGADENTIREEVRSRIKNEYPQIESSITIGQIAGYFVKFLSIKQGDIIVTTRNQQLYIYEVTGTYSYRDVKDHTAHRIEIDTKGKTMVPLNDSSDISPKFKRAAQNRLTIISLNEYATQIEMLINQ